MTAFRVVVSLAAPVLLGAVLAAQKPPEAAPDVGRRLSELRDRFESAHSEEQRKALAAETLTLMRLTGRPVDAEREMVLSLVDSAQESLQAGTPFPFAFDEQGRMLSSQITADFQSWAGAAGLGLGEALQLALYDHPGEVLNLIGSADSLAVATFQDALAADNFFVALAGATALGVIDHKPSVSDVIALSYAVPRDVAEALAFALEEFSSPRAQARAQEIRAQQ